MILRQLALVLSLCALIVGCGKTKPTKIPTVMVEGTVLLDGKPLTQGTISFNESASIPAYDIQIVEGKYKGKSSLGKKTVRIYAFRPIKVKGEDEAPGLTNFLPEKYNEQSKITVDIAKDGVNTFDFQVTSR